MASERAPPPPTPPQRMTYQSYLLRVRTVTDGEQVSHQFHLQEIPELAEHYFSSLDELMEYLRTARGGR